MATIIIDPARTVDIDPSNIVLKKTTDNPVNYRITAEIEGLWKSIIVWDGEQAYNAAGAWTNESVITQIASLIESGNVIFD
jgi:hypothetical protein